MIKVVWARPRLASWYALIGSRFGSITTEGVYIIWISIPGRAPVCVDVGQGQIGRRLPDHQADPKILKYRHYGTLKVTWAALQAGLRNGVERYLADTLKPLAERRYPDVAPIAVNLPAAAA
jgi:hypothetical protein